MWRWRALAAAAILTAACGHAGSENESGSPDATRVPVGLGRVIRDSVVEELTVTGRLAARPGGAALLAAPAAGSLPVFNSGSSVGEGTPFKAYATCPAAEDQWWPTPDCTQPSKSPRS